MAVLVAVIVEVASPVEPVRPESPDVATGSDVAVELASPVAPVLVAEDWPTTAPESPERVVGVMTRSEPPPVPPLASALAMLSPPVTRELPRTFRARSRAEPPAPATGTATPPAPPSPPRPKASTRLTAPPERPEVASTAEAAPEFA